MQLEASLIASSDFTSGCDSSKNSIAVAASSYLSSLKYLHQKTDTRGSKTNLWRAYWYDLRSTRTSASFISQSFSHFSTNLSILDFCNSKRYVAFFFEQQFNQAQKIIYFAKNILLLTIY